MSVAIFGVNSYKSLKKIEKCLLRPGRSVTSGSKMGFFAKQQKQSLLALPNPPHSKAAIDAAKLLNVSPP